MTAVSGHRKVSTVGIGLLALSAAMIASAPPAAAQGHHRSHSSFYGVHGYRSSSHGHHGHGGTFTAGLLGAGARCVGRLSGLRLRPRSIWLWWLWLSGVPAGLLRPWLLCDPSARPGAVRARDNPPGYSSGRLWPACHAPGQSARACMAPRSDEANGRGYVLAVTLAQRLGLQPVEHWLGDVPARGWTRLSAGDGMQ